MKKLLFISCFILVSRLQAQSLSINDLMNLAASLAADNTERLNDYLISKNFIYNRKEEDSEECCNYQKYFYYHKTSKETSIVVDKTFGKETHENMTNSTIDYMFTDVKTYQQIKSQMSKEGFKFIKTSEFESTFISSYSNTSFDVKIYLYPKNSGWLVAIKKRKG